MSYTVIAVKWRPRRFDELVGQDHVVQALVNSLTAERLHHAYLFSGTRGVGKTTVARILAKAFNCESGVSAEPCGECASCVAIDEGRFVDLIEVDAASRTRVDDTRELLDNVQYMPTRGRYKVYLIDEVHMLSAHSFNALLKTLEEPPPHVKFLFATTDPQKLPVTVLSRCLQFNLKKLPPGLIQEQLAKICAAEAVPADSEALRAIAKAADGSMRDAESLLDQGIAFGGGSVEEEQVKSMLGTIDRRHVVRLIEALAAGDGAALMAEVAAMDTLAPDYGAALDELMSALQRVAVLQIVGTAKSIDEDADLETLAAAMIPEDVQLYYQIALNGRRDIAVCRDERMGFEMTLLRMLAFRLEEIGAEPASAPSAAQVQAKRVPSPAQGRVQQGPEQRAQPRPVPPAEGRASAEAAGPASTPANGTGRRARAAPGNASTAAGGATSPAGGELEIPSWRELVAAAGLRGAVRNLADHCELAAVNGSRFELVLMQDKANFNTDQVRGRLQDALSAHLGRLVKIEIRVGEPPRATPAELRRANEDERMRQAREAIERDPNIKAVQAAFDAVLEPESIQPAGPKT